jgi:hypothetical protein
MFRHRTAIFRKSTNSKDHKSNTPLQVSNALTVIFKILKFTLEQDKKAQRGSKGIALLFL